MDCVPFDFSERVSATRNCCCNLELSCSCVPPLFVAPNWNQTKEKLRFTFYFCPVDGSWKYGFCNDLHYYGYILSLDELMKIPNLKNVRISSIQFVSVEHYKNMLKHDVVDMQKLLNFVSFCSNEARLDLANPQWTDTRCAVLNWLEQRSFSRIWIQTLTPAYHGILENQFSRWTPAMITVMGNLVESTEFLTNHLMSGELRKFRCDTCKLQWSSTVLSRIIQNVRKNPEDYYKNNLELYDARFDDSAKALMDEMVEKKLCSVIAGDGSYSYIFNGLRPIFSVTKFTDDLWVLFCM